jgi:hypothetical protein
MVKGYIYPFFVINKKKDENVKGKNCSPQSLPSFRGVRLKDKVDTL